MFLIYIHVYAQSNINCPDVNCEDFFFGQNLFMNTKNEDVQGDFPSR